MISAASHVLFEATLRALLVGLMLYCGLGVLRVANASVLKASWTMVLGAAIAMPLLMHWQPRPSWATVKVHSTTWSKWIGFTPPAQSLPRVATASSLREAESATWPVSTAKYAPPIPVVSAPEFDSSSSATPDTKVMQSNFSGSSASPSSAPRSRNVAARFITIGWILYFAVGAALMFRLLFGIVSSMRLWTDAESVESSLDRPNGTSIRWSPRVASPVNVGSGILLPAGYVQWDDEKLRVVLAHEYSHVRQRDFYLQLLAGLYAAVTWFSPLGWWLKRKLSELGEAISDHAALEAATSPAAYAELLLQFAAMPRPSSYGVAMAHSTNLNQRIARLLNESSFRRAFAGRRRAAITLLLPAGLIAVSTLVDVQAAAAAGQANSPRFNASLTAQPSLDAMPTQPAMTGQSHPDSDQVTGQAFAETQHIAAQEPAPAPAPSAAPSPEAAPVPSPPSATTGSQESMPAIPVIPPIPPFDVRIHIPPIPAMLPTVAFGQASCTGNDAPYAIVGDPGTETRFCGNWGSEGAVEVEKARSIAHGHFLIVRHEDKYYVVDDPEIVHRLEQMNKAVAEQAEQMRAASKQLRAAGQEMREQARKEQEAAANVPAPDLSKEMAELNATVSSLTSKQGTTISREELEQIQREISAMQRRVIDAEIAEVKVKVSIDMSKFNAKQDKFSAEMGHLGGQLGKTIEENRAKVRSLIEESLKDGKARPLN